MTAEFIPGGERFSMESLYETEISSEHLPDTCCITKAMPNDIDAIIAMRERTANKLWQDPETGGQWREPWPDDEIQEERILASINADETYMVWGGKEGVDLVGTFAVSARGSSRLWTPEEREDDNALYLSRLMAAEKGVGDAIIQTVRDKGKDLGRDFVRIDVWDTNERLINYYAQPERGFQIVRQNPIDGYPSCTLMQAAADRDTSPEITKRATQIQNRHMLELPARVTWANGYDDLGSGSGRDPADIWLSSYDNSREEQNKVERFYCPRLDKGWIFDRDGNAVGSLLFSSFLSSPQYDELLAKMGLREVILSFNPQSSGLSIERRDPITDYSVYEKYVGDPSFPLSVLLEGHMTENNSIRLKGGEISLYQLECQTYRLPTEKESGLQPAPLLPGDRVHMQISPDKTHADILKLANGEESNDADEQVEFEARVLVDEIYARLKSDETSQVYDLVQQFYSHDTTWLKHEEALLRKMLQRRGVYVASPTMLKLELADAMYNGMPAVAVRELFTMQLQDGTVEDLRRCMTYFRTFTPYAEDYGLFAMAIWEKAKELGCERDAMRTIYAKMVREVTSSKPASKATSEIIRNLGPHFVDIKEPLHVNKPSGEV